jgi:YegS/Rv2252/BmrU family lipid kinase
VIVNPRAGGGRAMYAAWRLEHMLRDAGVRFEIRHTRGAGDAAAWALQAGPAFEAIVAVGGDGTMHEVCNGLADAAVAVGDPARVAALAIVPFGTGNDFVKTLGMGARVEDGFAALVHGKRRRIDLGRAGPVGSREREWFANDFAAGFGAEVVRDMTEPPFYMRVLTGHVAYFAAGMRRLLFFRPTPMVVRLDGREEKRLLFYEVHVGNGRFCGGGIQYTPRAAPDDGLLDVTLLHSMPRWTHIATCFGPIRNGTLTPAPAHGIELERVRSLEIEQPRAFAVYLDGESRMVGTSDGTATARVAIEVVPAALDVLVPEPPARRA